MPANQTASASAKGGRTRDGESLRRIHGEQRWKRTGRKEGEKKPERNVAGTRARRRVEDRHSFQQTNRREPGREVETQKRGAISVDAETTEELFGALESSTRGETGLRAGDEPDPAELAGGDAPPCAEPPAAPTLYQSTDAAHSIRLSIIAERFAPLTSVSNRPSGSRITSFCKARELWPTRFTVSGQSFPWV